MFYYLGRFFCKFVFAVLMTIKVKGIENIPRNGGFILACNHASNLDPFAFGVVCPRPLHFMAKDTLFKNSFSGWIFRNINAFPLKRHVADLGAIKEALRRLRNQQGLLLFPEGTRSVDATIKVPREGVGFLARKSGVPVIPAFVKGTEKALPKGAKFIKPARINVIFGSAVVLFQDKDISDIEVAREVMRHVAFLGNKY